MIRDVDLNDAQSICAIYNYYVLNTSISFEELPVTEDEMKKRIADISSELIWCIYEIDQKIVGYAYASKWKTRTAYRYTAELSVYVDTKHQGKGIGTELYKHVIEQLLKMGIHSIIGGVALPNAASVGLHEKLGFVKVSHFTEIGFKFGKWIDVGYWQYSHGKISE